jgi:type IV secretory pathway TraG/TraD family ATPase VirD4
LGINLLSDFVYHLLLFEYRWWLVFGAVGGLSFVLSWALRKTFIGFLTQILFVLTIAIQPVLYLVITDISVFLWRDVYSIPITHIYAYVIGFLIVGFISIMVIRHFLGSFDSLKNSFIKKTGLEREKRSDIRTICSVLPKATKSFNPAKFFKTSKGFFLGLDKRRRSQYITQEIWRSSHVDIIGTTGSGKGVAAGIFLSQAIIQGEAVIVVDPKNDEWLPHVLGEIASKSKVSFYYIDLGGEISQWNPFFRKSSQEIEELFSAGFGLSEKGTDADFYRLNDRKSARIFSKSYQGSEKILPDAFSEFLVDQESVLKESPKFVEDLEELVSLPVTHVQSGLDISKAIEEGAVIYVRGSIRNPRILKLQKMFVLSVMQACENRDRDTARHMCIFLDEFKYLISKPALEALGAIRDKRAHVILAHQSLGDLRDCPKDIDPESVVASVNENCAIKIAYKVRDPDTADWLARMSGKILVDDELRSVKSTRALAEVKNPDRLIRQAERCLIDTNMLQSLPSRCAVIYGHGLADFIFTSPVSVKKRKQYVAPTVFESTGALKESKSGSVAEGLLDVG